MANSKIQDRSDARPRAREGWRHARAQALDQDAIVITHALEAIDELEHCHARRPTPSPAGSYAPSPARLRSRRTDLTRQADRLRGATP